MPSLQNKLTHQMAAMLVYVMRPMATTRDTIGIDTALAQVKSFTSHQSALGSNPGRFFLSPPPPPKGSPNVHSLPGRCSRRHRLYSAWRHVSPDRRSYIGTQSHVCRFAGRHHSSRGTVLA